MKKLLAILCLCLAACLLFGAVIAEEETEGTTEERVYTDFECVAGVPGVLRCYYGEDEEGNLLYDDKPMTAADYKNDAYHEYRIDYSKPTWMVDDVEYNVISWGKHTSGGDDFELIEPMTLGRTCARCGYVDTISHEHYGHFAGADGVVTPATCVTPEQFTYTCIVCGQKVTDDWGEPDGLNHSWVQAYYTEGKNAGKPIITKATCEKAGSKTLECEYCGATKVMEIAPRGHELSDEVTYVWDFKAGTVSAAYACLNTEETDEYEACKYYEAIETVKATGKLVNEKDCTEGMNWESEEFKTKGLEKQTTTQELEHSFGAPTFEWAKDYSKVTATRVCSVCGTKETEEVETVKTLKPDTLCTADDKITYTATFTATWITDWAKKNADAYKAATVKTMAGKHELEKVGEISWSKDYSKATIEYKCTEETCPWSKADSKGKYQTLTIDTVRTEDEKVPCDDENRVEWKADFSALNKEWVETKNGALEHEWDKPVIEYKGKNCEEENIYVKWCKHCRLVSVKYSEPVAPVYAATPDKVIVNKIYNPDADGSYCYEEETTEIYYCVNCGGYHRNYYEDGWSEQPSDIYEDHIKTIVTSKLVKTHNYVLQENEDDTTPCTDGRTLTYICIHENEEGENEGCGHVLTVKLTAHTWGEWKLVHKTGENGNELAYWTRSCTVCGTVDPLIIEKDELTCEDLKEEHTFAWTVIDGAHVYCCSKCGVVENKEIPDDVHTWSEEPEITPTTCLVDGKKVWTCEDCGATKEEAIKAVGKHTPGKVQVVTPATCEEDGLSAVTCTVCSEVLETKTIPATGHTAGDPVITNATCTKDGKTEITCYVCGKVLSSEAIPALGHTEVVTEGKAATCTEDGISEGITCSVCGEVIKAQEVIKAEGHKKDEGTVIKEATPTEKGVKEYKCSVCGEVIETEEIDFVPAEKPVYTIDATFSATGASGKVTHDDTTAEASPLYARVTVWVQNGDDLSYIVLRDKVVDGTFDVGYGVSGNVVGITVVLTTTADCASKPINSIDRIASLDI